MTSNVYLQAQDLLPMCPQHGHGDTLVVGIMCVTMQLDKQCNIRQHWELQ